MIVVFMIRAPQFVGVQKQSARYEEKQPCGHRYGT